MKKIFKNTTLNIIMVITFISLVGVVLYMSTKPVVASDTVGMKQFNDTIKKLETSIENLSNDLITKDEKIENLIIELEKTNNEIKTLKDKHNTLSTNVKILEDGKKNIGILRKNHRVNAEGVLTCYATDFNSDFCKESMSLAQE